MNKLEQKTGKVNLQELTESRQQLHYAIQFLAATGNALAEPQPDYSHTSLGWNPELNVFVGSLIQGETSFQVALDPVSLTSLILDEQGNKIAALPLHKKTLVEGLNWHKNEISKLGADASKITLLSYPPDDFPDHPVAHGTPFDASKESERSELVAYYANTYELLQEIIAITEDSSPIHIWPHHFDMATLISLPSTKDGEEKTIGIGLSPGDTSYDEPYWYVTPYPYPKIDEFPSLEGNGFWHKQNWVGAVLTASNLAKNVTEKAQQSQVRSFVHSALNESKVLLQEAA
ncbi:MAG TPA: hypothetical protein DCL61_17800 [Cyanobacteria bacterium UBA12227]|nr:hypothetical protein [Cyanobacteria bacterium UBA12227]HAX86887.1 hypothetical protein [Cyanobacteria bacterium UBA11370]HBY80090.1 hypothetical protein [Cyanobacteria bacterium UBA11148]